MTVEHAFLLETTCLPAHATTSLSSPNRGLFFTYPRTVLPLPACPPPHFRPSPLKLAWPLAPSHLSLPSDCYVVAGGLMQRDEDGFECVVPHNTGEQSVDRTPLCTLACLGLCPAPHLHALA